VPDRSGSRRVLPPDPVIDEIREVRRQVSARFDHDPERLMAHYLEVQKKYADRVIGATSGLGDGSSTERSGSKD